MIIIDQPTYSRYSIRQEPELISKTNHIDSKGGFSMATQISRFNRLLLALMVVLYLVSLGIFNYANWRADSEQGIWIILLNALILSLPLVLFYGSIYVLTSAWYEHRISGYASPRLAKVIHWAPRIAAIVIIFFVSLFSLDAFGTGASLLEQLGGFLIHSLPSIFMILMLVIAWRRPVVGFIAFLIAGLFFLRFVIFGFNLGNFMLFSGPLLLVSALFYADWRLSKPQSPAAINVAV